MEHIPWASRGEMELLYNLQILQLPHVSHRFNVGGALENAGFDELLLLLKGYSRSDVTCNALGPFQTKTQ